MSAPNREAAFAVAIATLGAFVMITIGWTLRDTFWGDPTIYFVYAKNAAAGYPFQFNPGAFSSGVASPMWSLVLAIPFALGTGVAGVKVLALISTLAAYALTIVVASRIVGSVAAAAIAAISVSATLAFYGALGYDSGLTVMVVAASLLALSQAIQRFDARSAAWLAVVWAILPLARAEAEIVVILEGLALVAWRHASLGRVVGLIALAALPAAAYYGYSQLELGSYAVSNTTRTLDHTSHALHLGPIAWSPPAVLYLGSIGLPLLVGLIGSVTLARRTREIAVVCAAGLCVFAVLIVVYPVTYDVDRYFLTAAPLLVVLIAAGLKSIFRRPFGRIVGTVTAGVLAIAIVAPINAAKNESRRGLDFALITEAAAVAQVNAIASPRATVLGYEVQDRFGMRPDIRYLAINGLTDGLVHAYRDRGDLRGFLLKYRPELWVMNDPANGRLYTSGTLLETARTAILDGRNDLYVEGVRFTVVARRSPPEPPEGFAGWQALVRITYPEGE